MSAVGTLWWREMVRFVRQRSRLVGAFGQPLVFWLLLGGGLDASFRPGAGTRDTGYLEYFFPGVIAMVLLFTAIFATISAVEDRTTGFLQGALVAPVRRSRIVLGQALGGTTLAMLQGGLFLTLAPFAGIAFSPLSVLLTLAVMFLMSFALTALGLMIAWQMESTQGFHAVMNLLLMPIWFLSGAVFPAAGAPVWLAWVMALNPLTYGMAALRRGLYLDRPDMVAGLPALIPSIAMTLMFALATWWAATWIARRA